MSLNIVFDLSSSPTRYYIAPLPLKADNANRIEWTSDPGQATLVTDKEGHQLLRSARELGIDLGWDDADHFFGD